MQKEINLPLPKKFIGLINHLPKHIMHIIEQIKKFLIATKICIHF